MTAGEDQPQAVVWEMHGRFLKFREVRIGEGLGFVTQGILFLALRPLPPALIDQLAMRRRSDPGCRVLRDAFLGPGRERRSESLLHRLLGPVERSRDAN